MGFDLSFKPKRKVNIVIKDHVIRYLELKNNGKEIVVKDCKERYLPDGVIKEGKIQNREKLTFILAECVEEWKIKNREVQFIVPDQIIVIRRVQVPGDLLEDEIQSHLFLELGASIHLPFEEPLFEFKLLPNSEQKNKQDILLIAAPEETVEQYRQLLEDVSLDAVVADISSLSIYRLYYSAMEDVENEHLLLIQYDLSSVNLTIFNEEFPVFSRHIVNEFDEGSWEVSDGKIAWTKNEEDLQAVIEEDIVEMDRVMNFYRFTLTKGKEEITKILIIGDNPYLSDVIGKMKDRFTVPIMSFDEGVFQTDTGEALPREQYLALGLALKEVQTK
ncbi:type IV pilus biogenesis protein PilM [Lottiidibacillus patelloidae]|uniref:type IV pilus biogenesis protein PilM n=1 Tax=Lottiidibacillus patelloidae TaxID=2670334 RepID=UPI0013033F80|nr:pilus assembly protein PilM [Lottiidibacillus patelloidae]